MKNTPQLLSALAVSLVAIAMAACSGPPATTPTPTGTPTPTATPIPLAGWTYQRIEPEGAQTYPGSGQSFIIGLPPEWIASPMPGIDSFIGEITGEGAKLTWDLGWYSSNLNYDDNPDYTVTQEKIGERDAKLVRSSTKGAAGVYFAEFSKSGTSGVGTMPIELTIYGEGLTDQQIETAFVIFRTIR